MNSNYTSMTLMQRIAAMRKSGVTLFPNLSKEEKIAVLYVENEPAVSAKIKQAGGIMDSRAQFEKWMIGVYDTRLLRQGENYMGETVQRQWEVWQASRAAMKQELPLQHEARDD